MRRYGRALPEPRPGMRRRLTKAGPFAPWKSPHAFSPASGLLLVLEAVQGFVLVVKFAGVGQGFGIRLGINVAISAGLFGCFRVFRFAERDRGAKQETAQQDDSGQSKFEMGHDASSRKK